MVGNCGNGGILSNFTAKVRWTLADDYYVATVVQAAKLLKPIVLLHSTSLVALARATAALLHRLDSTSLCLYSS